jgi:hypothetical protein
LPEYVFRQFKRLRLMALNAICTWQQNSGGDLASREWSLALRATALWMLNALNSRPKSLPAFNALADYALPHTDDAEADHFTGDPARTPDSFHRRADDHYWEPEEGEEGDGQESTWFSHMPFGVFMTRALVLHPETDCPRFKYSPWRWIPKEAWSTLLRYDLRTLRLKTSKVQRVAESHPDHVPRSTRPTQLIEILDSDEEEQDHSFELGDMQEALLSTGHDDGDDLPLDVQVMENTQRQSDTLKSIWRSFARDVFALSPTVKGSQGAHLRLSIGQLDGATLDLFKTINLADVFMHCRVRESSRTEWKSNIAIFFLPRNAVAPRTATGWQRMAYWKAWGTWKESPMVTPTLVNKVRSQILKRFDEVAWLPLAATDRPWTTRSREHGKLYPENALPSIPAPIIILHPRKRLTDVRWIIEHRSTRQQTGEGGREETPREASVEL